MKEYQNILESIVSLFTIDRGIVKVFLLRKRSEPYKGYWILPNSIVSNKETLEQNVKDLIYDRTTIERIYLEQDAVFSHMHRDPDERIIGISYIALTDSVSVEISKTKIEDLEYQWFPIDMVPKLGYDHDLILEHAIATFRKQIVYTDILKMLFPSDFTLAELHRAYEQILGRPLDRRNFRKKFLHFNMIDETGDYTESHNGRPAKLYRFKEQMKEMQLIWSDGHEIG